MTCAAHMVAKARRGNPRALGRSANQVEARARAMTGAINSWLTKFRRVLFTSEIEAQVKGRISKADTEAGLMRELDRILASYGLRQMGTAINGNPAEIIPAVTMDRMIADREVRLQAIVAETRTEVRAAVRDTIRLSLRERPQPSAGEIARRIRTSFAGPKGTSIGTQTFNALAVDASERGRTLPTAKLVKDGTELYAFSNERAALISRTELNIAQNSAHLERIRLAGFTHKEWLSYTDAIYPSGALRGLRDRRHNMMNGVTVPIDQPFLVGPEKQPMMYPGDPQAPVRHLANCRCSIAGADG